MPFNVDEIEKNIESMNTKIKKADELIIHLEQVSKHIEESKNFLDSANQKFEQLTITDEKIKDEMSVVSENLNNNLKMSLKENSEDYNKLIESLVKVVNNVMINIEKDNKKTRSDLKIVLYLIAPLLVLSVIQIFMLISK